MIDRQKLLSDLQRLLKQLEADLRERCDVADIGAAVWAEYESAKAAKRTAQSFEEWRADYITQIAAAWILTCVFARFLEDNQLVEPPKISGPGERLHRARDEYDLYVHDHPADTVREYLLSIFDGFAKLPDGGDVFGEHNPIHEQRGWISGDAAKAVLSFWQQIEPATGSLVHDFTDPNWDTRFLGDLYQDLSDAARKKYALLQTPEFVEEFILERTLEPALDEFGLEPVREEETPAGQKPRNGSAAASPSRFKMIDPACGSGHFLLGSFRRILDRWQRREPGTNVRELVQRTLDSVHGVDVNPFAVAIARFRLLLAAMRACGIERLADAPAFRLNLVCGDSLLHAPLSGGQHVLDFELAEESDECDHAYRSENLPELKLLLRRGRYHAVVGNPPYIIVKDRALSELYRARYPSCHGKYSLSAPFMERFFDLAVKGDGTPRQPAGFVGQITANSFMKREFGKKLIEEYLPRWDLTHVLDTAGAYIPGHGTPTVILFGKNQPPVNGIIRTVLGIRGEPATPADPAKGVVWQAILRQIDEPGSTSEWASAADSPRDNFHRHPWSIGGGGAAELKERINSASDHSLVQWVEIKRKKANIGFASFPGVDEAFVADEQSLRRLGVPDAIRKPFLTGDAVRDWLAAPDVSSLAPYDEKFSLVSLEPSSRWAHLLWPSRTTLSNIVSFGRQTRAELGHSWWGWYRWIADKYKQPNSLIYGEIATHNHFAFDTGNKVFKNSVQIIKLKSGISEAEHVQILGVLNSSSVCFWLKQVCHNKGSTVDNKGARQRTAPFEDFFAFNATQVADAPIPARQPTQLPNLLVQTSTALQGQMPSATLASWGGLESGDLRACLALARDGWHHQRCQLIALQEELDWQIYEAFSLVEAAVPLSPTAVSQPEGRAAIPPEGLELGQRAFEIVLARHIAAGETQTTWFERHGSTPITELPEKWPDDYRQLVQRRIDLIEDDPNIRLIEQPEYKRRWNTEPWDSQLERALREWLLDRMERYFDFDGRMHAGGNATPHTSLVEPRLISTAQLADIVVRDANFMQVAELYRDRKDFDATRLVADLVAQESVPLLPVLRYKAAAMDTRAAWERTWQLQRQEDLLSERIAALSAELEQATDSAERKRLEAKHEELNAELRALTASIQVPPKYKSSDFQSSDFWRLRGKLDVPKERWVSFPHCEGEDQSLIIAWAGYDHLQLAKAISGHFADVQQSGGSEDARLIPLLCGILELVPWLKQWHNDVDPTFGYRLGDYFEGFVRDEALALGKTVDDLRAWRPSSVKKSRKKSAK